MTIGTVVAPLEQLVADIVKDTIAAAKATGVAAKLACYSNLAADVIALLPQASQVQPQLGQLKLTDIPSMIETLVSDLALSGNDAAIAAAISKLITDVASTVVPDVEALMAAIKGS